MLISLDIGRQHTVGHSTLGNDDVVGDKDLQFEVQGGQDDLTVPDEVGDVLDGLQVVGLPGICEGLLLQSIGVVS